MSELTTQQLVNRMTDHVNTFNVRKEFVDLMANEHRTLQQSFTRLCLQWLERAASEEYKFDLRNQKTHEVSRELVERFKKENYGFAPSEFLPYI